MTAFRTILLCSVAAGLGWSAPAMAQDSGASDSTGVDDIIVTATRREERLQDVPLAVSAIGAEALRNQNISNVVDLGAGRIPGLTIVPLFGNPAAAIITIRGLGPSDASQGTLDMPVAFYVDGINFPRAQGLALDLVTPERIEVLRGPQGQLFGRNAESGVVQIVTRRPSGEWGGEVTAGVAEYSSRNAKGRLELPEIAGFRVQLSAFGRTHDGYTKNLRNPLLQNIKPLSHPLWSYQIPRGNYDRDYNWMKAYGARIAVERDFGPLNMFYTYDNTYVKETQNYTAYKVDPRLGTLGNPNSIDPDAYIARSFTSNGIFTMRPVNQTGYPKVSEQTGYSPIMTTKSRGHMLNLTFEASDAITLKSITGYRHVSRYGENTQILSVSGVMPISSEYLDSKAFSQELQLQYTADSFNVTTGAIYFNEKVRDERDSKFAGNCLLVPGGLNPCDPIGVQTRPSFAALFPGQPPAFRAQTSRTNAYAAYAQATWTPPVLNEMIELTGGIRYSHNTKRGNRFINGGVVLANPIRNTAKTDRFDPAFTVKLNLSEDLNVYARYASGFRDGGANVRSNTFNAFDPEVLKSYEIGFKGEFLDRRVRLNLAAFKNTIDGHSLTFQPQPSINPGITDTVNIPFKTRIKGLEAELTVRPTSRLSLTGSLTYLDKSDLYFFGLDGATIRGFKPGIVSFSPTTGIIVDAATKAAFPNSGVFGAAPFAAPKWSGSINGDYEIPLSSGSNILFHADWTKTSTWYTSGSRFVTAIVNGVATPRPTYNSGVSRNRVNARISWRDIGVGNTKMDFSIYANNLFNQVDTAFVFAAGNALNAGQPAAQAAQILMPPRIMGAEVRIHF